MGFRGIRPQSVRNSSEDLLNEACRRVPRPVAGVRPEMPVGVQRDARGGVSKCALHGHDVAALANQSRGEEVSAVVETRHGMHVAHGANQ
jgi:hypothetical protein